jgi:SecD/SecF fusion protein
MRNKGFFWFITILVAIVCVFQISYTFVTNRVEKSADKYAFEQLDSLKAVVKDSIDKTVLLPNGRSIVLDNIESEDIISNYFTNAYLIEQGNKKAAWTGATYNEAKNRSINLGLDLKGGMSVTLEISIPDLIKNEAANPRNSKFAKPYEAAEKSYRTNGGDFINVFVDEYKKANKGRNLIDDFYSGANAELLARDASDNDVVAYLRKKVKSSLSGVENIMNRRINQFGVAQPNIQKDENANRVYIELPGVKDKNTVRQKLQSTANLEFFETHHNVIFNDFLTKADKLLTEKFGDAPKKTDSDVIDLNLDGANDAAVPEDAAASDDLVLNLDKDTTKSEQDSLKLDETESIDAESTVLFKNIVQSGYFDPNQHSEVLFFYQSKDTATVGKYLRDKDVVALLPVNNVVFMWASTPTKFEPKNAPTIEAYALHAIKVPETGRAHIQGNDIDNARQDFDQVGRVGVSLKMTSKGTEKWAKLTNENYQKTVAICMDGMVVSSPMVQARMNDGRAIITGNYTVDEAKEFAALLNAGSLPAPCVIIDESVVGSTLGEKNISSGMTSFAIALLLVLLYMVFYYSKAGLIANVALLVNILFILGSLASFGAVLTLAGIAGIVLTIGMSVDANVLIFERIREEVTAGKGQKQAVADGFSKALSSILDANITTLLTAIILKIFGSGPIESFATTLIIGIFSSVFAAVVVSRLIFEWVLSKKTELSFSTKLTAGFLKGKNIPFMQKRKLYYMVSGVLVVFAISMLATRGLKYGIEFTGGRSIEVRFDNAADNELITKNLKSVFIQEDGKVADVIVKKKESKNVAEIQTNFLHTAVNADTIVDLKLKEGLALGQSTMGNYEIVQSRSISAVISDELKTSSTYAILLSLAAIFLYILLRFGKWQFGLGALVAMTHDVLLVLGAFAALHGIMPFNMDIDQAFIAAILTVVGYSINDTVVIFDRIRETMGLHKKLKNIDNINESLNSTLSRTTNTSISTLVVLLTIFFLGGAAIKGFIFALIIGVVVGTYSSICIASPLIVDLTKENEEKAS